MSYHTTVKGNSNSLVKKLGTGPDDSIRSLSSELTNDTQSPGSEVEETVEISDGKGKIKAYTSKTEKILYA